MSRRTKKIALFIGALLGLAALGLFAFFGCPSIWAEDFPVDPADNAHLATTAGLSAEAAALEAIHWRVPAEERVPRDRVSLSISGAASESPVVRICYPAQDDSIHMLFDEVTLSRQQQGWSVTRLRRCWTGRGLIGWSTDTPS